MSDSLRVSPHSWRKSSLSMASRSRYSWYASLLPSLAYNCALDSRGGPRVLWRVRRAASGVSRSGRANSWRTVSIITPSSPTGRTLPAESFAPSRLGTPMAVIFVVGALQIPFSSRRLTHHSSPPKRSSLLPGVNDPTDTHCDPPPAANTPASLLPTICEKQPPSTMNGRGRGDPDGTIRWATYTMNCVPDVVIGYRTPAVSSR